MTWRYQLARRLNFIMLVISVVMMILLPWPKKEVRVENQETDDPEC